MTKFFWTFLVALTAFDGICNADQIGFEMGKEFFAAPVEGIVLMTCVNSTDNFFVTYNCRDVVLDPKSADVFMGPVGQNISEVVLTALHEDGSLRTKSSSYDSTTGRSSTVFNLWVSTLFQKPLLMRGLNRIRYSFTNGASANSSDYRELSRGEISIHVSSGSARKCPKTRYSSTDPNDCTSQYSICQRYFENFNYCR